MAEDDKINGLETAYQIVHGHFVTMKADDTRREGMIAAMMLLTDEIRFENESLEKNDG